MAKNGKIGVGNAIVNVIFCTGLGGVVGLLLGGWLQLGVDPGSRWPTAWPFARVGVSIGLALGFVAVFSWIVITNMKASIKEAEDKAKQKRLADERCVQDEKNRRKEREEARNGLRRKILACCENAASTFQTLPRLIDGANGSIEESARHFDNGAFSPFWSAVESAYLKLGAYADAIRRIEKFAADHNESVENYLNTYGNPETPLPAFPVDMKAASATQAVKDLAIKLSDLAYKAQCQPTFAVIWEQRRTTSVLVAGFKSLETAVQGMHAELSNRVSDLISVVENNKHATIKAILGTADSLSQISVGQSQLSGIAAHQSEQLSSLISDVNRAVWQLKDQRNR